MNGLGVRVALRCAVLFGMGLVLPFLVTRAEVLAVRRSGGSRAGLAPRPPVHSIDVVLPAYLEASVIGATIDALRRQAATSPVPLGVVLVASDDDTAEAGCGADLVLRVARSGKAAAVNQGVAASVADVVVLMDGNCTVSPDDWPALLVSALAGADVVSGTKSEARGAETAYWRFEDAVKRSQAREPTLPTLSVVGEFLALRRSQFREIPAGEVLDDLWVARSANDAGLHVVVDPRIRTSEAAVGPRDQWERRVRISSGHFAQRIPTVLGHLRTTAGRLYLAHKLYRQTIGPAFFWAGVLAAGAAGGIPGVLLVACVASRLVAEYAGRTRRRLFPRLVSTVVGLQAVPVAGVARAVRRHRRQRRGAPQAAGWAKVAR